MFLKDAILKCLSSSDEVSFGRAMSGIAFLACILWDTFFVGFAAHKFNIQLMNVHDILPTSEQLIGQAEFCSACYGIHKVTELVTAFANRRGPNV